MISLPAPGEACRACGSRLAVNRVGVVSCVGPCGDHPMYGEAVGVTEVPAGRGVRLTLSCSRCGLLGTPSFWNGRLLLECPRCDGAREPYPEPPAGCHWVIRCRRAPRVRVSRNAPCPCGSGVKAKKCHPERC